MRPDILFSLFAPVTKLAGIGPRLAKTLEKLAGPNVIDLCWHLPTGLIDRRFSPTVEDAPVGQVVTLTLTVDRHEKPHNRRSPYRVHCHDDTGSLSLVFFHARDDYLRRLLPEGDTRIVSGRIEDFRGDKQMTHPDHVVRLEEKASIQVVEPVYPMTAGLSPKTLVRAIRDALARAPELPEWLDAAFLKQQGWSDWATALRQAHSPERAADLEPGAPARQRLAYDELLANQLALVLVRARLRKSKGREVKAEGRLRQRLAESLPYTLTGAQERSVGEIIGDMSQPLRMLRLLQGDVGSGKTVTALVAMLEAVEAGGQAALLAPTEILARQHYQTISELLAPLDIPVAILTGRDKGRRRREILSGLEDGSIPIIVGTHALFQEEVAYKDLMLAVIDEQHRFGVHQRLMLAGKGRGPVDVLVMTATPIPRTLTLTAYGDMDVSRLDEKPPGRQPIDTRAVPNTRVEDVIGAVGRAMGQGRQVYWVCPLVEESDVLDVSAAEARYQSLREQFGDRVGLVHGQMKGEERDRVMEGFVAGDVRLLVATTVIEVGVDVPNATIMVIEHSERFGLAQLHQLRGRVGRGADRSSCLLLYGTNLTETARERLRVIRNTEDGFLIAEEDLRLRGAGELLGTRQSGLPEFRLAVPEVHGDLIAAARDDALLQLEKDPELKTGRGEALRVLLYLFQRDEAIRYLGSG